MLLEENANGYKMLAAPFAVLLLLLQSQPPNPAEGKSVQKKQQEATVKEPETNTDKPFPVPSPTPEQQRFRSERQERSPTDLWAFVLSVLNVMFTGGLVRLMYMQWRSMEQQGVYMRSQLAETKRSADAAKMSADVAMSQLSLHNRADIRISKVLLDTPYVDLAQIVRGTYLIVEVANCGTIRAEQVVCELTIKLTDSRTFNWRSGFARTVSTNSASEIRVPISQFLESNDDYIGLQTRKLGVAFEITVTYIDELRTRTPVTFQGVYEHGVGIQEQS
jgi:hypothetical protein